MNEIQNSVVKLVNSSQRYVTFVMKYKIIILFLIGACVIVFALMESRTYLDPVRNEEKYTELRAGVNYSKIDEAVVEKLGKTQQDKSIEVDASLVPNRSNPFNEN